MQEAAKQLLAWGCKIIVATKGPQGAYAYTYADADTHHDTLLEYHASAIAVESVVDTTGAGDAFVAGFLVEWVIHHDLQKALEVGCYCGASAIQVFGGSNTHYC
jgi:adenosine kinase